MTLTDQLISISRTYAIQHGAKIDRTPDEVLQDILVSEPLLAEAETDIQRMVETGELPKEVL
jgi:hypothetical protein